MIPDEADARPKPPEPRRANAAASDDRRNQMIDFAAAAMLAIVAIAVVPGIVSSLRTGR